MGRVETFSSVSRIDDLPCSSVKSGNSLAESSPLAVIEHQRPMCQRRSAYPQQWLLRHHLALHKPRLHTPTRRSSRTRACHPLLPWSRLEPCSLRPPGLALDRTAPSRPSRLLFLCRSGEQELSWRPAWRLYDAAADDQDTRFEGYRTQRDGVIGICGYGKGSGLCFDSCARCTARSSDNG